MVMDLSVRIGSLELKNPILTASGTFGYGLEYEGLFNVAELGGICTTGLSLEPRAGNAPARIASTALSITPNPAAADPSTIQPQCGRIKKCRMNAYNAKVQKKISVASICAPRVVTTNNTLLASVTAASRPASAPCKRRARSCTSHNVPNDASIEGNRKARRSEPVSSCAMAINQKCSGGLSWYRSPPACGMSH